MNFFKSLSTVSHDVSLFSTIYSCVRSFIVSLKLIYKKIGKFMATLSPPPRMQFFDQNGDPLVGGKVYTYLSGTTTPTFTKTTAIGDVNNTNPVILDARGEAAIWLDEAIVYRFVLKTATDVTIWTGDGISGFLTPATKGQLRFTADGSFNVPAGVTKMWVSGIAGGGGGGGGGSNNLANSIGGGGGGGGAGQAAFKKVMNVTPGEVIPITIGLGGAGGAGGTAGNDDAVDGSNGTDTIIGTYLTLAHGIGGNAGAYSFLDGSTTGLGGAGGSGGTFGALIDGQQGGDGSLGSNGSASADITYKSGDGGSSLFGAGGRGTRSLHSGAPIAGKKGSDYGSGGGGGTALLIASTAGAVGGAGADGMVLIEW
jgi:hypothetical protein